MEKDHFISKEPRVEEDDDRYSYPSWDLDEVADRLDTDAGVRFSARIDTKAIDEDGDRTIEGYASTKDIDRVGEVIKADAFDKSLELLKEGRIKILEEHTGKPVGKIIGGRINSKGLWIKARIFKGIRDADEAWSRIVQGGYDSFSVGFRAVSDELVRIAGDMRRVITEGDLWEVSLTGMPANIRAAFSVTKSLMYGSDQFTADRASGLWVPVRKETEGLNTKTADYSRTRDYVEKAIEKIDSEAEGLKIKEAARKIREKTSNL